MFFCRAKKSLHILRGIVFRAHTITFEVLTQVRAECGKEDLTDGSTIQGINLAKLGSQIGLSGASLGMTDNLSRASVAVPPRIIRTRANCRLELMAHWHSVKSYYDTIVIAADLDSSSYFYGIICRQSIRLGHVGINPWNDLGLFFFCWILITV